MTTMEFLSITSILLLLIIPSFSNPILPLTDQPYYSLDLNEEEKCPYTVIVTTSCSSPDWSRDQITIALGDANGNQVVARRLDEPLSGGGGFEKCSSDTFQIKGKCLNTICSLYIYRSGPDGWIPKTVEIYKEGSKSVKFDFNENIPENIWFGHNNCNNTDLPPPSPDFPPFSPTIPPPSPPHFPPLTPSIPPPPPPSLPPPPSPPPPPPPTPSPPPPKPSSPPPPTQPPPPTPSPPPPPRPSAAYGRGSGESLVVVFAAIAFGAIVV